MARFLVAASSAGARLSHQTGDGTDKPGYSA